MSKNITIQEGGTGKQMTVDKLKTDVVGGGSCLWVPEDTVNLTTKNITENGTYPASSDNAYGYSQVTVNVRGGNGSANPDGTPNPSHTLPGGQGHAIVGTDLDTGEPVAVGVDEEGIIVTTPIPAGIDIIALPTKTSYTVGETMDYTDIVVAIKKNNGDDFTNATYPTGRAPYASLIFPVRTAPEGSGEGGHSSDLNTGSWQQPIPSTTPLVIRQLDGSIYYNTGGIFIPFGHNSSSVASEVLAIADRYDPGEWYIEKNGVRTSEGVNRLGSSYIHDGKTVFFTTFSPPNLGTLTPFYENRYNENCVGAIAWTALYGSPSGAAATIPVQWESPYDGRTFEDTFEITVSGSSSGSGSTEGGGSGSTGGGGYSDDSGGSSSVGGGGF